MHNRAINSMILSRGVLRVAVLMLCGVFALTLFDSSRQASAGSKKKLLIGIGIGVAIGAAIANRKKRSRRRATRRSSSRNRARSNRRAATRNTTRRRSSSQVAQISRAEGVQIQTALSRLGLYTMDIDGAIGPGSRRAISAFQNQQGFRANGRLTAAQKAQLFAMTGVGGGTIASGGAIASAPSTGETDIFGNSSNSNSASSRQGIQPASTGVASIGTQAPTTQPATSDLFGPAQTNQAAPTVARTPAPAPAADELESIFDAPAKTEVAESQAPTAPKSEGSSLFD